MELSSLRINASCWSVRKKRSLVKRCQILGLDKIKSVSERPAMVEVHWYEIVWQWRKTFLRENWIVHIMTVPCVLLIDSFKLIVFLQTRYSPEDPLKLEWEEGIYYATNDSAYTYIWLTSSWNDIILDQLMCKIAICSVSKRLMNLQNYPRNRKSNRIQQPEAQGEQNMSYLSGNEGGHCISIKNTGLPLQIQLPPVDPWPRHWHSGLPAFWKLPLRLVDITWT